MSEWRLFEAGAVPDFTTLGFFAAHRWIDPGLQHGHAERTALVVALIRRFFINYQPHSLVDLGCGDGSLLAELRDLPIPMWGYDAGLANVSVARSHGLEVTRADFLSTPISYGELIVATEVLEHLIDPHGWLHSLPGDRLVVSSPSAETDEWHYEHHAWAWDMAGYRALAEGAGWKVVEHVECEAADTVHDGVRGAQRFQAISAIR